MVGAWGQVYSPGAGHAPPLLAGRDGELGRWRLMLNDVSAAGRRSAQDLVVTGPRGVGKTVLVSSLAAIALESGFEVVTLQAVRGRFPLVDALVQQADERSADGAGPWVRARRAFERVAGVSLGAAGFSASVSTHRREEQPAVRTDPRAVATALAVLAQEVRRDRPGGGVLVTVDEMQVARPEDLALLAATLHRLNVEHPASVVTFAGTGLPHTHDTLIDAGVTHPERLFTFEALLLFTFEAPVTLPDEHATLAVVVPAQAVGVVWHPDAVAAVLAASNGYPAHLQLMAHEVWQTAPGPAQIRPDDAQRGIARAAERIITQALGPRWGRIPDRQLEYLAAVAVNGGATTVGALEITLGRRQQKSSPVRDALIEAGDIYAPRRGHVQLTVRLFGRYILDQYEIARAGAARPDTLLSLDAMRENLAQHRRDVDYARALSGHRTSPGRPHEPTWLPPGTPNRPNAPPPGIAHQPPGPDR